MNLFNKIFHNKNVKMIYYAGCLYRELLPAFFCRILLERKLKNAQKRKDYDYILQRVNYYNKLEQDIDLKKSGARLEVIKDFKREKGMNSVYYYDPYRYLRWFDPNFFFAYDPGDITEIPPVESLLKSRPLHKGDNTNSVVMKLNSIRHFVFLRDDIPFSEKKDKAVFRLVISQRPHRERFMQMYFDAPFVDAGIIKFYKKYPREWVKPYMSMYEHLNYKFIMTIEGNETATNLKWVMSSNSLAVMPKPKYETWFMEGKLIANYHYVEIKDDYSDLKEKMDYYGSHTAEAEAIIKNANQYVEQFKNNKRERLISLLVADKYFRRTGQK